MPRELKQGDSFAGTSEALLGRPPLLVHASVYILLLLLMTAGLWSYISKVDIYTIAVGSVRPEGHLARVQTTVTGRVMEVRVKEGDKIDKGQVLCVLDRRDIETEMDKIRNKLGGIENRLQAGYRAQSRLVEQQKAMETTDMISIENARLAVHRSRLTEQSRSSTLDELEQILADARRKQNRAHRLFSESIISKAALQAADSDLVLAQTRRQTALADHQATESDVKSARKNLEIRLKEVEIDANRRREAAEEVSAEILRLQEAERNAHLDEKRMQTALEHLEIRAPMSGIVTSIQAHNQGEVVQLGSTIATIAPREVPWIIESYVTNRDAGPLREQIGARVKLKFDAFPYHDYGTLEGSLVEVSPDAEMMTNRGSVYGVKITLPSREIKLGNKHGEIRLGMTVRAEIVKEQERILALLFRNVRDKVSYD